MVQAFNEPKYQIEVSTFRCESCGAEVACKSTYYSAVSYEEQGFRRKDYCLPCWKRLSIAPAGDAQPRAGNEATSGSRFFAYWRTTRPPLPSEEPKRLRFDPDLVLLFFRRLGAREEDGSGETDAEAGGGGAPMPSAAERDELRFVLALLLIRKKILNFTSSQARDGREWLKLVERKDPRRCHWVPNPQLADSRLEKVKDRVGELLQMRV